MTLRSTLLATAALLVACASAPRFGPEDEAAMAPVREAHRQCLQDQITALIDGSDDVGFLTRHIVGLCDPALRPAREHLAGRGFNPYFVSDYVQRQRNAGAEATADTILRVKSLRNRVELLPESSL